MGLFDKILYNCAHCGHQNHEQTKNFGCYLETFDTEDLIYLIAVSLHNKEYQCDSCEGLTTLINPVQPSMQPVKMLSVKSEDKIVALLGTGRRSMSEISEDIAKNNKSLPKKDPKGEK